MIATKRISREEFMSYETTYDIIKKFLKSNKEFAHSIHQIMLGAFNIKESAIEKGYVNWDKDSRNTYMRIRENLTKLLGTKQIKKKKIGRGYYYVWVEK